MTDALSGRKFLTLDMSARLSFHILMIYILQLIFTSLNVQLLFIIFEKCFLKPCEKI